MNNKSQTNMNLKEKKRKETLGRWFVAG